MNGLDPLSDATVALQDAYRAGFSDARVSCLGVEDYRLDSFRGACFSLALETSGGSLAEAARLADVDPRTISRWLARRAV